MPLNPLGGDHHRQQARDEKTEQQIEQQKTNKNRLITILRWKEYQGSEQQNEQQVNNKRTTSEQPVNTNKNVKKIENDKNVKKLKEIYKEKYLDEVFLAKEEYQKLIDKFGETLAKDYIQRLDNYMGSKGKKYANHYKTILMWADKNNQQSKGATNGIKRHSEKHSSGTVAE